MLKRPRQAGAIDDIVEADDNISTTKTPAKTKTQASKSYQKSEIPISSLLSHTDGGEDNKKLVKPKTLKTQSASSAPSTRIKAALDYGTTNSAVAFVKFPQASASDVEVINSWPGGIRNTERLEKVPSRYAFAKENKNMTEDAWGYGVPAGVVSYAWTKLLLDMNSDTTKFDSDELSGKLKSGLLELPSDMEAGELATEYLTKVYEYAWSVLQKREGDNLLRVTPVDWWVTVPATWSQRAIAETRDAAFRAGFGARDNDTIQITTEPEAAAIASLSKAADKNPDLVKKNTNALIADLGGGTLDFQILRVLNTSPVIETEEPVRGIAGKSGSTYIDCQFHRWMQTKFGDAFSKIQVSRTGHGSKFMSEWETLKTSFTGDDLSKIHQIPLPVLGQKLHEAGQRNDAYDETDFCVLISGYEVQGFFDRVIDTAFRLMDDQIDRLWEEHKQNVDIICLCGGLGESSYVWKRFQGYCQDELRGECQLHTDKQAWSAVVRGAAIRGLNGNTVITKKAKLCYGIGIHRAFIEGEDHEDDARWCPAKGKRAEGYVCWFIMTGKAIHKDMPPIRTPVYEMVNEDDDGETVEYELFSCALNKPPERQDAPGVHSEGFITLDLSKNAKRQKQKGQPSKGSREVRINIVAKMGDEQGTVVIEAKAGKISLGSASIDLSQSAGRSRRPRGAGAM